LGSPTLCECSKISLRIPHLTLRVAKHARRAEFFAKGLIELGVPVVYSGLDGHPDHELINT